MLSNHQQVQFCLTWVLKGTCLVSCTEQICFTAYISIILHAYLFTVVFINIFITYILNLCCFSPIVLLAKCYVVILPVVLHFCVLSDSVYCMCTVTKR